MPVFVILFLENFFAMASHNAVSLLPPYLTSLGAGNSLVGVFNSINTLALMVAIVLFGRHLVRLDRPLALRRGFALLVVAYLGMYGFQTSLPALFAFKILGSVSFVFAFSMLMNMVYDRVPPEKQTGSMALFGISGLISNPITSWGGEQLVSRGGGPMLFLFGAALAVCATLLTFALKELPGRHATVSEAHVGIVLKRKDMRPLIALGFLFGSAWSVYQTYLPGFTLQRLGLANLTAYTVPFAAMSIASRFFFARRMDTTPPRVLLGVALSLMLASFVLVQFTSNWAVLWVVGGLYGLAHSVLFPLISSLYVKRAPEGQRNSYNNAFIFFNNFGPFVLVPLLGALADGFGYSALFGVMGVVSVACLGLALFALKPEPLVAPAP